jgi:hypothetical protein
VVRASRALLQLLEPLSAWAPAAHLPPTAAAADGPSSAADGPAPDAPAGGTSAPRECPTASRGHATGKATSKPAATGQDAAAEHSAGARHGAIRRCRCFSTGVRRRARGPPSRWPDQVTARARSWSLMMSRAER